MRYDPSMSDIQSALTVAIRVRLARRNMTQGGLAEAVGLSPASLSARLTGRVPFDTAEVEVIAKALGLDDAFELFDLARTESRAAA